MAQNPVYPGKIPTATSSQAERDAYRAWTRAQSQSAAKKFSGQVRSPLWANVGDTLAGGTRDILAGRNRTLGRVPLLNEVIKSLPMENAVKITEEVQRPGGTNWGTVGKNVAGGAYDIAALYATPARVAELGGFGKALKAAGVGNKFYKDLAIQIPGSMALEQLGLMGKTSSKPVAPGSSTVSSPASPKYPASAAGVRMFEEAGKTATSAASPALTTPGELPTLTAAEQLAFDTQARQLRQETDALMQELAAAERIARNESNQAISATNRQVAGGSQDLRSALGLAGLSSSPGVLDVGISDVARRGAEANAAQREQLAQILSGYGSQRGKAQRSLNQELANIEVEKLQRRQRVADDQINQLLNILAGGK